MHASIFSYNLTRPYPFRWFTPTVFIGGAIAIALITFLSVSTQGYQLVSRYESNPNDTSSNVFSGWPSALTANTKTICASTAILIGTEFYTNNTALKYTISSIWKNDAKTKQQIMAGSFPYHNNLLQDCYVVATTITFEGVERGPAQIAEQQWGASLKSWINCVVETSDGIYNMNLTTTYDFNPEDRYGIDSSRFIGRNVTSKASLWWGESLLGWYYEELVSDMYIANEQFADVNEPIYKGEASLIRTESGTPSAKDIMSLDFFDAGCFFIPFTDTNYEIHVWYCHHDGMGNRDTISNLAHYDVNSTDSILPGIWISSDSLAKVFYATVLADLGQTNSGPNILDDADLLTYFSKNITLINNGPVEFGDNLDINDLDGLATSPFNTTNASKYNLGINPSIIQTDYLCQEPRLKEAGSLIFSVLVNNIVLLSAIWRLFKLSIDYFLARKHPYLMYCEGCLDGLAAKSGSVPSVRYEDGQAAERQVLEATSKPGYQAVEQFADGTKH